MLQNFEYKGQWFLPSNKDARLNGILTYDAIEGSTLELFGSFGGFDFIGSLNSEEIILGVTSNSKKITLYKTFVTHAGGTTLVMGEESGHSTTIYRVNFILEGAHIDSKKDLVFNKIKSEINNLDEWLDISGFAPITSPFANPDKIEINVKYELPEPINFKLTDDLKGEFYAAVNHPGWNIFQKEITIKQRIEFIISSEKEYSLEDILKNYFIFQNFIVLSLYNSTFPSSIKVSGDRFMQDYGDGQPQRTTISVYFSVSRNKKAKRKLKHCREMIFTYGHIKDEFQKIINIWYRKYNLLEPAFNLLFDNFYNDERFTENTFLNLAQAAETFHARTDNHTKMPRDEYETMKDSILKNSSPEYHKWLKEQFNFGNNLNLHARLADIVNKYSNPLTDRLIGDKELFIKQVKYSRNYYTHYSASTAKHALKGTELLRLTEKLKILLVCAFLIEVGFDSEKLSNLLEDRAYLLFNHLFIK